MSNYINTKNLSETLGKFEERVIHNSFGFSKIKINELNAFKNI